VLSDKSGIVVSAAIKPGEKNLRVGILQIHFRRLFKK
jgi:hypothetical protein